MIELTLLADLQNTINKERALLVYFYNDDCPPCISLRPKVDGLIVKDFPAMKMIYINSKESPEIPAHYGIFSNPVILVFFDGKEYIRKSKYISMPELASSIERLYSLL